MTPAPTSRPSVASNLLEPVFDLDTGEEIVDQVAVSIMVRGQRHVDSTRLERCQATGKMIRYGHGVREIAMHIGCSIPDARDYIACAGYKVIADPMYKKADGGDGNRLSIVKRCA